MYGNIQKMWNGGGKNLHPVFFLTAATEPRHGSLCPRAEEKRTIYLINVRATAATAERTLYWPVNHNLESTIAST